MNIIYKQNTDGFRCSVTETHQVAEAQQEKNAKLREAFGISKYFVDGSSFDQDRQAKEDLARAAAEQEKERQRILLEKEKEAEKARSARYELVHTPSPEPPEPESRSEKKKKRKARLVNIGSICISFHSVAEEF